MAPGARVLVVDDTLSSGKLLEAHLLSDAELNCEVTLASGGQAAWRLLDSRPFDLLLTDLVMPGVDGAALTRRLRADPRFAMLPVVVVSAHDERDQRMRGLEAGADDYVVKPVYRAELLARVRTLLRVRALFDTVQQQAAELTRWNAELEQRVALEVERNRRLSLLQRFFSPALAQRLLEDGDSLLASHRQDIVVVFLDLRGYTAFSDQASPDDVMRALAEYHREMGELILRHEGTLERFTGDGLMVFFNDPLPQADAADRALTMALQMQQAAARLSLQWEASGFRLGLSIGIARGEATLGRIGFEGRIDYAAIGGVTNLAHRLCEAARAGEVLATRAVLASASPGICGSTDAEALLPAGFRHPVEVVRVQPVLVSA